MNDDHVHAQQFAELLATGGNSREQTEHVAHCAQCKKAVDEAVALQKLNRAHDLPSSFFRLIDSITRSSFSMLVPSFLKFRTTLPGAEQSTIEWEPLRVFLPKTAKWFQGSLGKFSITLLVTVTVLLLPSPIGMSDEAHKALAAFVFTASVLALQPISLPLAALMIPVAMIVLGIADVQQSFETFSRPVIFLILASLFLAEAFRKHGLSRRLALLTIIATGGRVRYLLLGLMGLASFLSMWVENTATAAVLIPVALTISKEIKNSNEARSLLTLLALGIAYSASLGGMVTIMGSASNAVASGFLVQIKPWHFVDWTKYGLPAFVLIFPFTWWLLLKMVPVSVESIDLASVRERAAKAGRVSRNEKNILYAMSGAVLLWVSGSYIEPLLGLPRTLLSSSIVAVVAVIYLALRNVISWDDIKGVSWGILFVIGAGLSLGETLNRTGATDWLATLLEPLIIQPPLVVSLLMIVLISALLTNVLNNTTIAAVLVPVVISIAGRNPDFNAVQLVLPLTLATTFGYSLPSASGRMALIAASGLITGKDMLRYGLIATIASSILLSMLFYFFAVMNWM